MSELQMQDITHVVCVGAVYIDTVLTVPHFPSEDTKLRATSLLKRRGGNTPNTLEVLTQLVYPPLSASVSSPSPPLPPPLRLHLLSILPSPSSADSTFIRNSIPTVNFSTSLFRAEHDEAASSYIIQSQENSSRTIVSVNTLPELTVEEFTTRIQENAKDWAQAWFHFEGRTPETTAPCIRWLRENIPGAKASLECEKPDREGLEAVLGAVDVLFFSRIWAEAKGFHTPKAFLASLLDRVKEGAVVCCTWGAGGAAAIKITSEDVDFVQVRMWSPEDGVGLEGERGDAGAQDEVNTQVIDTIGAGDTFIAGMLYALIRRPDWMLQKQVEFANQIAGRKVLRVGFGGLGEEMREFR